jgi:hypothetical protein
MLILLPAGGYRQLLRNSRPGTPSHNALRQADTFVESRLPRDQFAVVCDLEIANALLKLALACCPDTASIIEEGIQSTNNSRDRR